ncbi:MAG: HD domain-containing protein [Hyphomicrobiales bacterium]|nr:HD domain-containing protein [Hyphomicrobiales bacterium]
MRAAALEAQLADFFEPVVIPVHDLARKEPAATAFVDIDLANQEHIGLVRSWLKGQPTTRRAVFSVRAGAHREFIQAHALGATDVLTSPVDARQLFRTLRGELGSLAAHGTIPADELGKGILVGFDALRDLFSAAMSSKPPDVGALKKASDNIIGRIAEAGVARWLEIIRDHHSQTYQHCLTVTALAAAFGQLLGFSAADKRRLASAALLHDFGKALIPVDILEKPAPLSREESAIMRKHAELGFEALRGTPDLDLEMLDLVVHHHEYLDGSGYPHGIGGSEISDLVRVITIADVYGALIERRSYKAPISSERAYQLLRDMGQKLDIDLVRAFGPLTRTLDG